jgi:hypothetical protein
MGAVGAAVAGGVASGVVGTAGSLLAGGKAGAGAGQANQLLQQQRADLAPYREAGLAPLQAQQDLLGLNGQPAADAAMANFQQSPGYQWQLQQGLQATDAGAAAKGMLRSGAALKAEETFGQGLANQDFTNYYNRLMGLTTLGANAAAGGAQTAETGASLAQGAGNTQASIYGNLSGSLQNSVNSLFTNPAVNRWLTGSGSNPVAPGSATPVGYQASTGNTWYS